MKHILSILSILLFCCTVVAQQNNLDNYPDDILLEQINIDDGSLIQTPQQIQLKPITMGFKQAMEMLRSRVASAEWENHVQITQNGSGNMAEYIQEGRKNAAEISQSGDSNQYQGTLSGDDNLIDILQSGSYNEIYQVLAGDNMQLQVIQQGSGNELIQIETQGNAPNYQVHQQGEGMKIHIEHGIASFPFGNQ